MKKGYIYAVIDKRSGEPIYVGCTTNLKRRINSHFTLRVDNPSKVQPIQQHIYDNGKENFDIKILEESSVKSVEELYERESLHIEKHQTYEKGFNKYKGGSLMESGKKNPNARGVKCTTTGEVFSSVTEVCNRYGFSPSEMASHLSGKRYINGIGKLKVGQPLFFEYLDKEFKVHTLSPEVKNRISKAATKRNNKAVLNKVTGEVYENLREAAKELGVNYTNLSSVINGNLKVKTYEHIDIEYIEKV